MTFYKILAGIGGIVSLGGILLVASGILPNLLGAGVGLISIIAGLLSVYLGLEISIRDNPRSDKSVRR